MSYSDSLAPNILIEARAGRNRFGIDRTPRAEGFDVTALGMPALLNTEAQFMSFPYSTISDVSPIGMNQGDPASQVNSSWTAAAAMTWLRGAHGLKMGGELRAYQWDSVQGDGTFRLNFDRGFTRRDPNTADASGFGLPRSCSECRRAANAS